MIIVPFCQTGEIYRRKGLEPGHRTHGTGERVRSLLVAETIEAIATHPPPERYGFAESAAVLGAVLLVLNCYFEVKRDETGKWTFTVGKKAADTTVLTKFLETLSGFAKNLKTLGGGDSD
jgi:hypothetical protein